MGKGQGMGQTRRPNGHLVDAWKTTGRVGEAAGVKGLRTGDSCSNLSSASPAHGLAVEVITIVVPYA